MSPLSAPGGPSRLLLQILRIALLGAAFLIPAFLMRGKSATFDEVAHLPAGYSYLATGRIQINPQHPPLLKEMCALPLLFLEPQMPVDAETLKRTNVGLTYQWAFGKRLLYTQDADRLLFWGRVPAVLLSLGLALLVSIWAGRLWGAGGGLLALALYVLDPTITAHAQLVTTDVGLAFFATLFLFFLRRHLDRPTRGGAIGCGALLGLALAAKFSAIILLPIAALLMGLAAWQVPPPPAAPAATKDSRKKPPAREAARKPGGARNARLAAAGGALLVMIGVGFLVVWATYFFPLDPLFYLRGLRAVNMDHDPNYLPYLLGEFRPGGWRSYLTIAYLVKTPIPTLLLLGAAVAVFFRGRRAGALDEAFLMLPAAAFYAGYSITADNLGVRYLIPCFPFLFIFAGRLIPALASARRIARPALAAAMVWLAGEFALVWPDHLSYFNQITGPGRPGYRWLDDSNLDWGQGLIQLKDYLAANPPGEFRFCYFGSGDPAYYGIRGQTITIKGLLDPPAPGTYILSAHCVARVRALLAARHGEGPANWPAHAQPSAVVGHVFQIYEFR